MRWQTAVIYLIVLLAYAVLGAVIFMYLESGNEQQTRVELLHELDQVFSGRESCVGVNALPDLNHLLETMFEGGVVVESSGKVTNQTRWELQTSIFVSLELIATIGYILSEPASVAGKALVILNGFVGTPMLIIAVIGCAELLNSGAESIRVGIMKCLGRKVTTSKESHILRTIAIVVVGIVLLVLIPCAILIQFQTWTYAEGLYYCFLSIVTIGFSDFVPGFDTVSWMSDEYVQWYRLAIAFWELITIGWFSGIAYSIHYAIADLADKAEQKVIKKANELRENFETFQQHQQSIKEEEPDDSLMVQTGHVTVIPVQSRHRKSNHKDKQNIGNPQLQLKNDKQVESSKNDSGVIFEKSVDPHAVDPFIKPEKWAVFKSKKKKVPTATLR